MKRWLLISSFGLFCSLSAGANNSPTAADIDVTTEDSILLTYEQFSQLTHAEQKTYIKKLRETMLDVAQAFPEFAAEGFSRSQFYAELWRLNFQNAFGQTDNQGFDTGTIISYVRYADNEAKKYAQAISQTKIATLDTAGKAHLVEQYRQALYWSASAASQAYNIPNKKTRENLLRTTVSPTKKLIETEEAKVKQVASESEYSIARDQYFKKAHRGELPSATTEFPEGAWVSFSERLSTQPSGKPTVTNAEVSASLTDAKEPSPENAAPQGKPNTSNNSYYRCMYSGFVIKSHPCVAPSKLPWDLKGLDSKSFTCEGGTVMCNPFLFGFKSDCSWSATATEIPETCTASAKPYCVRRGLYATKNCGEASNNDAALEAAVHLIHNNALAFNQYGESFQALCNQGLINFNSYKGQLKPQNTKKTKADIKRTCDNARVQMAKIKKRYLILKGSSTSSKPPGATGESSSPKPAPKDAESATGKQ